ncbi:MAG: DUF4160 domain-containing protein [Betaproteobacteria bacterium]|nr:DUF4160 domain-containing protein [Betaproteobacteria bacterium]
MPEISRFLGIVITMYFNDHNPPHFHVRYEEYRALIGIEPLELREGQLPPRVLGLVMEWGEMHHSELMENWTTLAKEGIFRRIAPLV